MLAGCRVSYVLTFSMFGEGYSHCNKIFLHFPMRKENHYCITIATHWVHLGMLYADFACYFLLESVWECRYHLPQIQIKKENSIMFMCWYWTHPDTPVMECWHKRNKMSITCSWHSDWMHVGSRHAASCGLKQLLCLKTVTLICLYGYYINLFIASSMYSMCPWKESHVLVSKAKLLLPVMHTWYFFGKLVISKMLCNN